MLSDVGGWVGMLSDRMLWSCWFPTVQLDEVERDGLKI